MENILKVDLKKLKVDEIDKQQVHAIVMPELYNRMEYTAYIEDQQAHPENYSEFELTHPDIAYKTGCLPTYFEELDEDGNIVKAYKHSFKDDQSCMIDITNIKLAERELEKQKNSYYRMLISEAKKQNA